MFYFETTLVTQRHQGHKENFFFYFFSQKKILRALCALVVKIKFVGGELEKFFVRQYSYRK